MKQLSLSLVTCICILTATAQDKRTAPLSAVIEKISKCWQDVDQTNKNGITLESVSASFALSKTTTIGGEIKIWIFKFGKKVEKNSVSKITLELTKGDESKRAIKGSEANEELTKFINATLTDFKKMDDMGVLSDLSQRKITIEIGLTITKSNTPGAEIEIGIFALSAEAGKNSEQANTLTLVFSKQSK